MGAFVVAEDVDVGSLDRQMLAGILDWDLLADHALQVARGIARKTVRRYGWLCEDDIQQDLVLRLQRWVAEYQPDHGSKTTWSKYLFHKMNFYVLDLLRKEDPLGIKWPQRSHYPEWSRLGDTDARLSDVKKPTPKDYDDPDLVFQRDLAAVDRWAQANKQNGLVRPTQHVGPEPGVLRAMRLNFWDKSRNRVGFKRGRSFENWVRTLRKGTQMQQQVEATGIGIRRELMEAGRDGLASAMLSQRLGLSSPSVQAGIRQLKKSGEVFRVANKVGPTGRQVDYYALSQFWPDGPPIKQTPKANKAKPKPKPKANSAAGESVVKVAAADGQNDLMALIRTVASLRNERLKSGLLELIESAVKQAG